MMANAASATDAPDLEIRVSTEYSQGRTRLNFQVSSPSGAAGLIPIEVPGPTLRGRTANFQATQIRKIELLHQQLDVDGTPLNEKDVQAKLEGLGRNLYYDLFPPEMREIYRQVRNRTTTLLIISDDYFIPWELIKPFDASNTDDVIDENFFCLRFQMTRWLAGAKSPPKIIYARSFACVEASGESVSRPLPTAARERGLISSLKEIDSSLADLSIQQATCDDLICLLDTDELGIVHFAGHGDHDADSPNESSLLLDRPFRASDLHGPVTTKIAQNRPLVFLNSCRAAQQGLSATGPDGWVERWVAKCGCGVFLGPQWVVEDEVAFAFAEIFYKNIGNGSSIGNAVLQARKGIFALAPANPAFLSFSVFAHPGAHIVFGSNPNRGKRDFSDSERADRGLFFPPSLRSKESPRGDLPLPPVPCVVHRYTLMPTSDLVGRRAELEALGNWARGSDPRTKDTRILSLVAIGGMGKSALAWKWFNDHAPEAIQPLAGRFWWSFYEHDATFQRFIVEALAYVTCRRPSAVAELSRQEQEDELLAVLDERPFLLGLDGIERLLLAYARLDAARLLDDDLDRYAAHMIEGPPTTPWAQLQRTSTGGERLRSTQDPRAGKFLAQLSKVKAARCLVSTRLYPVDLQDRLTRHTLPGTAAYFLHGLRGIDSLALWRSLGGGGDAPEVLPILEHIEHHPLVLRALAGEVACFRRAPGDFRRWRDAHPQFDPSGLSLVQARSHILAFALRGLDQETQRVAQTIAALRMPASYEVLNHILVDCQDTLSEESALVSSLEELENRGVAGWDREKNQYDMHPLVRGVLWNGLDEDGRRTVHEGLRRYFEGLEPVYQYQVYEESSLVPAIELCQSLTRLERYEEAYKIFRLRIDNAVFDYLNSQMAIEILELFFPNGTQHGPKLSNGTDRRDVASSLAKAYEMNGQLLKASRLLQSSFEKSDNCGGPSEAVRCDIARGFLLLRIGSLTEAEQIALRYQGNAGANADNFGSSQILLTRTRLTRGDLNVEEGDLLVLAERALRQGKPELARTLITSAMEEQQELAGYEDSEDYHLQLLNLRGWTLLELDRLQKARETLQTAVTRARTSNSIEYEVQALILLAEAHLRLGDLEAGRESLEGVWEPVERGPLRLLHADARAIEASIEAAADNPRAAAVAATRAFELAWCDGPPFAYHWGLLKAQTALRSLNLPDPPISR